MPRTVATRSECCATRRLSSVLPISAMFDARSWSHMCASPRGAGDVVFANASLGRRLKLPSTSPASKGRVRRYRRRCESLPMSGSKFRDNLRLPTYFESARLAHAAQNPASSPKDALHPGIGYGNDIGEPSRKAKLITPASSSYVAWAIPCSPFGASVGTFTANRLHSHIEGLKGAVWPARNAGMYRGAW